MAEPRPLLAPLAGTYREWSPVAPLRRDVRAVWTNQLATAVELEIVPDGCMDIIWTGDELQVAGPDIELATATFARPTTLVGIRFEPGAAPGWLRASAAGLVNSRPSLAEFWGAPATRTLADRLSEAKDPLAAAELMQRALLARLPDTDPPDPIVQATVRAAAHGAMAISRLVDDLGCSERTLRRRCREAFGYGPKTLQRILRFQRVLGAFGVSEQAGLSALALDAGYADQAHLAREVRQLSGRTPTELRTELAA